MKKLNITKEQFNRSRYFKNKYGKLEYVSESGKLFKTNKGNVLMFKEGKFEAIGYVDKAVKTVSVAVNQNGTPYEALKLGEAIVEYSHHMLADLFSNNSLPFPGYSFLRECDNRKIRKFSADMYKNGFNLKNVIIQSASTIAIEIIIRLYFSIVSVKFMQRRITL